MSHTATNSSRAEQVLRRMISGFRVPVLFAGLIFFAFSSSNAAGQQKAFTAEDLLRVRTIVDTQISPDGSKVLFAVSEADLSENSYQTRIWLISTAGGLPFRLTNGPKTDESPRWSPDGQKIAFISERDGKRQIWLINPGGGEAEKLTDVKTAVISFEWSPDGKQIAFLAPDPPSEEQERREREHDDARVVDENFEMDHIHVFDLASRAERQVTKGKFTISDFSWSPNNREIAFTYRPTARTVDDYKTDVYVANVLDGSMRALVQRPGRDDTPRWSPDGSQIAFESTDGELGEFGNVYLFVVPAAGGTPRNVMKSVGERMYDSYGWSPDNSTLYFRVRHGVSMQLLASSVNTGEVHAVTTENRVYDSFSFSKRPKSEMAFVATDAGSAKDLYVSPTDHFEPVKIFTANPDLKDFRTGVTKIIHWKSRDGLEIEGLLTLPVAYREGNRYPLIAVIHGGPSGAFTIGFAPQIAAIAAPLQIDPYPPQLFCEQGYALFMPNIRGSGGYGERFRKADIKDWGGADFDDVMTGIDELVRQGIADPDRLGIMGWSYGGFMSAWAITQTSRFKAASVGAGPTDLFSGYGSTDQPDQDEAYFGGPPWEAKEFYEKHSAMSYVANIKTPTLIQHGEHDSAVPLGQAEQLYRALVRRNIPVQFVIYPRSGHAPVEPKQNLDVWRRNLDWFNRWLKSN